MKKLYDAADRFCARHPRFGIPHLMRYIIIGTVAVYVLQILTRINDAAALDFLALTISGLRRLELWRLVTFIFVPLDSSPFFLIISLYFYHWIGSTLEQRWGTARFSLYYISGVVLTVIASVLTGLIAGRDIYVAGTTYVNLSMFLAFAALFPDVQVLLFFIIPVKIKWIAYVDLAFFALEIVSNLFSGNWLGALLPVVAIFNYVVFIWPDVQRFFGRKAYQHSSQTVNFKKAVRQQEKQVGYHHKCAVCGRTDTEYPDLQFRYCSKCAGYHCFCQDHIFSHVHFTEE